jgi:hypothetical protein
MGKENESWVGKYFKFSSLEHPKIIKTSGIHNFGQYSRLSVRDCKILYVGDSISKLQIQVAS